MMPKKEIETLFKSNYGAMHRLAAMILHDVEAAHDVVHDVFEGLLSSDSEVSVKPSYLMACVRNGCVSRLRKADVHERFRNLYPQTDADLSDEDWPDESTFEEISRQVGRLPSRAGEVFRMRYYEGMEAGRIASMLDITERAVYKHLHHALELLRTNLRQNG